MLCTSLVHTDVSRQRVFHVNSRLMMYKYCYSNISTIYTIDINEQRDEKLGSVGSRMYYVNTPESISGADLWGGFSGCATIPPSPEMTSSFLIQLALCKKMWFIGVGVSGVSPPKKILDPPQNFIG